MSISTLSSDGIHPPDPGTQFLPVPTPSVRRRLSLRNRLALRIGIWLIMRAHRERPVGYPPADARNELAQQTRNDNARLTARTFVSQHPMR